MDVAGRQCVGQLPLSRWWQSMISLLFDELKLSARMRNSTLEYIYERCQKWTGHLPTRLGISTIAYVPDRLEPYTSEETHRCLMELMDHRRVLAAEIAHTPTHIATSSK